MHTYILLTYPPTNMRDRKKKLSEKECVPISTRFFLVIKIFKNVNTYILYAWIYPDRPSIEIIRFDGIIYTYILYYYHHTMKSKYTSSNLNYLIDGCLNENI